MSPKEAIEAIAAAVIAQKDYLTDLDRAIGDGDHGINMARGFESVVAKIDPLPDDTSLGELLKTVGICLVATVGGAAGPLYGTAFMRMAPVAAAAAKLDDSTVEQMFAAAIKGIQDRGKADRGDKTMLDALMPAQQIFAAAAGEGAGPLEALHAAALAAARGVEGTKDIMARKGRASYLGMRSIGHADPGAASVALILQTLDEYLHQ